MINITNVYSSFKTSLAKDIVARSPRIGNAFLHKLGAPTVPYEEEQKLLNKVDNNIIELKEAIASVEIPTERQQDIKEAKDQFEDSYSKLQNNLAKRMSEENHFNTDIRKYSNILVRSLIKKAEPYTEDARAACKKAIPNLEDNTNVNDIITEHYNRLQEHSNEEDGSLSVTEQVEKHEQQSLPRLLFGTATSFMFAGLAAINQVTLKPLWEKLISEDDK